MTESQDKPRTIVDYGKDTRFKPGHPHYPAKRLSIRQQRRARYQALSKLSADMCRAIEAGRPVSAVDFTRVTHLLAMLEREDL
jgi:hypothetical protein